jgi:hypothetical protein
VGGGACFALSANPLWLSPYNRLVPSLGSENATDQKLTNCPHYCPQHLLTNFAAQQEEQDPFKGYEILVARSGLAEVSNLPSDVQFPTFRQLTFIGRLNHEHTLTIRNVGKYWSNDATSHPTAVNLRHLWSF